MTGLSDDDRRILERALGRIAAALWEGEYQSKRRGFDLPLLTARVIDADALDPDDPNQILSCEDTINALDEPLDFSADDGSSQCASCARRAFKQGRAAMDSHAAAVALRELDVVPRDVVDARLGP